MPVTAELFQNNIYCKKDTLLWDNVLFLVAKKSTKRRRLKGTFRKGRTFGMIATGNHTYLDSLRGAPPLRNPCARNASRCPKMFRFLNTYNTKIPSLGNVDTRKSEHFRVSDGVAAGGFLRRALFRSASLSRLLWLLSWRSKKVI